MKSNIGLFGLGVMGENLAMNMERNNFQVSIFTHTVSKVDAFVNGRGKNLKFVGCHSINEFVDSLEKPRRIFLMIKAGQPVDDTIELLIPLLEKGDILIDGGNSNFEDTIRRANYLESKGLLFIGTGVSGGEEGALNGPSLMPGGSFAAWEYVKPIFEAISAKVDNEPCTAYMSKTGAGHYVKMVHNGIEYGDMELICETYDVFRKVLKLDAFKIGEIFEEWNKTKLDSYLVKITSEILKYKDDDNKPIVDKILDTAGQKGTGKWTSIEALNEGIPLTLISEAVYARSLSALKNERVNASKILEASTLELNINKDELVNDLKEALYAAKIISYAQGFSLLKEAAKTYDWDYDYSKIAAIWRGGCIIRSIFLNRITDAYKNNINLENLMLDPYFSNELKTSIKSLRKVVAICAYLGIPSSAFSSALSYYDGYRSELMPQNLLQAQRDYFGAHTYERVDKKRGEIFHTNWTGHGGKTTASNYNA